MYAVSLLCKYCLKPEYFGNKKVHQGIERLSNTYLKAQIEDPTVTMHRSNMQLVLNPTQK